MAADYRWLGSLTDGTDYSYSQAVALSADGSSVIGSSSTFEGIEEEAFHWTAETGMLGMGSLGAPLGADSWAVDITDNGDTALGTLFDYGGMSGGIRMYTWQPGGDKQPIDLPATGYPRVNARAISADGSVLAGYATNSPQSRSNAFVWTSDGGYQFLDLGPSHHIWRHVDVGGLSADAGVVVGDVRSYSGGSSSRTQAYRWEPDGEFEYLGYLPGGDNDYSTAADISADGSIIVGTSDSANAEAGGGFFEAFRWTEEDGMVGLGDLPGGDFNSWATAISADGSVIVGEATIEAESFSQRDAPFIWTEEHGMRNLRDVFLDAGIGADFVAGIEDVVDVSADGQTFIGNGSGPEGALGSAWIVSLNDIAELLGDYNGNGIIDAADYTVWQDNFGNTNLSINTLSIIPEPSTGLALFSFATLVFGRGRVRRATPSRPTSGPADTF
ncbi:hypothetical protein [Algisphaera agarilytica]|uniref:Putative HAF family extracellular repeat protein n=1 Tax=Algisphaera agarilytica TaxID=1385975 RepID=A0A7X0LKM4_9BACT|nr:hypothetical protein [Algisphaera agarilytica]MBB6429781.1 putative HAF family extracellular repeat protein [Algisphaera agarilytica]